MTEIFVCTHKKMDDLSLPEGLKYIQVGASLSGEDFGYIKDNNGIDNISERNREYCELTAHYYVWKNSQTESNIGFCHYRRYFNISVNHADNILKKYDIILPNKSFRGGTNADFFINCATREDLYIALQAIKKLSPEYYSTAEYYLFHFNGFIGLNMFITSRQIANEYFQWSFSILDYCYKNLKLSEYSRLRRVIGYIGEFLLPIYCFHNKLKIKYVEIIDKPNAIKKITLKSIISKYYHNIKMSTLWFFNVKRQNELFKNSLSSLQTGLRNDGIINDSNKSL